MSNEVGEFRFVYATLFHAASLACNSRKETTLFICRRQSNFTFVYDFMHVCMGHICVSLSVYKIDCDRYTADKRIFSLSHSLQSDN